MEFVYLLLGAACGLIISTLIRRMRKPDGTLRIDHSNPGKDLYRFEIDNLDLLDKKQRVMFTIDHNADLSQK